VTASSLSGGITRLLVERPKNRRSIRSTDTISSSLLCLDQNTVLQDSGIQPFARVPPNAMAFNSSYAQSVIYIYKMDVCVCPGITLEQQSS
jgi:hypothetical protein